MALSRLPGSADALGWSIPDNGQRIPTSADVITLRPTIERLESAMRIYDQRDIELELEWELDIDAKNIAVKVAKGVRHG